jgi:RecB family exonuclease
MSQQLGLEGMPRPLFACTPSRLTTWLECPRRYRLSYLERPAGPRGQPWAHTTVGAVVHLALARWWSEPLSRRTPATARSLVERAWPRHDAAPDGFQDEQQSAAWRSRSADMAAGYVASLDPRDEPAGVERTVAARTERLALSGRVDRIDRRGDELVVVDYKTGRTAPTDDDARGSSALALYALAAGRTLRRRCTRVELHHLPTGRIAAYDHDALSIGRHVARAEAVAEQIAGAGRARDEGSPADEVFPPRSSRGCAWCDHLSVCPEGRAAAGPQRRPWDGLASDHGPQDEPERPQEQRRPDGRPRPVEPDAAA